MPQYGCANMEYWGWAAVRVGGNSHAMPYALQEQARG